MKKTKPILHPLSKWLKITSCMLCLTLLVGMNEVRAGNNNVEPEKKLLDVSFTNESLEKVLLFLKNNTGLYVLYNSDMVRDIKVTVHLKKSSIEQILKEVLKNTSLEYVLKDDTILIRAVQKAPAVNSDPAEKITITGKIISAKDNQPIAGALVSIKKLKIGEISNEKGEYSITFEPQNGIVLDVSCVGMQSQSIPYTGQKGIDIILKDDNQLLSEVVVTGFFTKNANSFTGSVKSLGTDELKAVSGTNIISAIAMLTPGLRMVDNNKFGSNPNKIPEFIIRGTSSLATEADEAANQPIIILDGVEISMRELYDIDINDIERVDVLKDASATALYGEKAANGVIIIERKPVLSDALRLSYNLDTSIDLPDLNTYNYLNAADKLEFERLAGLYDFNIADQFEDYNNKFKRVATGLDTDWLSKPLRSGYTINNSIGVSGRGNNMTYRVNANMRNQRGVMKGDSRDNIGLSTFLSYHVANKVTVSYQTRFTNTNSKESPYGSFSDYIRMNPYDSPYDEYGRLVKFLSWGAPNPLYEATVGNINKTNNLSFTNTLKLRWYILENLFIDAQGNIITTRQSIDHYTSPESTVFAKEEALEKKGSLDKKESRGSDISGKFTMNYSLSLDDDGTMLSAHLGGDIYYNQMKNYGSLTIGYTKKDLNSPNFATSYGEERPYGAEDLSTRLGMLGNLNFIYKSRYFIDGSFRRSGSSKFGTANKYAPFWSVGLGWNLHNEAFFKDSKWLSMARLRYSYGVTGSIDFSPYQAITTYTYSPEYFYLHGVGAIPKGMGNEDLKWQSTGMHNIGANIDLFGGRVSLILDYYTKTTRDMLVDLSVPLSVGQSTIKANLGRMQNKGFEFDLSAFVIQTPVWRLNLKLNGAWNNNKILAISNALSNYNDENNKENTVSPKLMYKENQSTTAIYAVRSAGINPATGQEVFINRYGQYTLLYDAEDKVVVGDSSPILEGGFLPSLSYKNWNLTFVIGYRFGGHIYNETRAANVENVDPKWNVDRRAYEQRWKNINDVVPYLDISNAESRVFNHTSRFVEKDNTVEFKRIELSYEFDANILKNFGFKRLRLSFAADDPFRISSVKYERGTDYPFSRGFSFSISPTF